MLLNVTFVKTSNVWSVGIGLNAKLNYRLQDNAAELYKRCYNTNRIFQLDESQMSLKVTGTAVAIIYQYQLFSCICDSLACTDFNSCVANVKPWMNNYTRLFHGDNMALTRYWFTKYLLMKYVLYDDWRMALKRSETEIFVYD